MTDLSIASEPLLGLDAEQCLDPRIAGGKAAALARAARAGLPVLDALVLTTAFTASIDGGRPLAGQPTLDRIIEHFGDVPLVVRSSSTAEDGADSSMAGRFESVLDVRGIEDLTNAVARVLGSRARASLGTDLALDHPIGVLVQPFVPAETGGVLFGVDPVSGRSDRLVVVAGSDPEQVVNGLADSVRNELDHAGKRTDDGDDETLPRRLRERLAALAARTAEVFGHPQDMEWLLDEDGDLRLLQSRPVTTEIRGVPQGPLYGPGPVAETFPDPLRPLERDLWVPPLQEAMGKALVLAGAASPESLEGRQIVVAPGGRVAVDLEVTGQVAQRKRRLLRLLDLRPGVANVRSAWRVGRLRAALPDIAMDVIDRTDTELRGVVDVATLTDRQLVALIDRAQRALVSLHAYEILMGLVVDPAAPEITGASVALRVLGEARRDGRDDSAIIEDNPIVLALAPPRIAATVELPQTPDHVPPTARVREQAGVAGLRREALRLRVRWVQELMARAAWEVGHRLVVRAHLATQDRVVDLHWDDAWKVLLGREATLQTVDADEEEDPLPGTFRLSDRGRPIPVRRPGVRDEAVGAGGGVGSGPVTHDTDDPPSGSVLVVTTLRPGLAPLLGRLRGLVAETGSPLAHLAILAREAGVPTVVGVRDAVARFPEGCEVQVDGTSGQITDSCSDDSSSPASIEER